MQRRHPLHRSLSILILPFAFLSAAMIKPYITRKDLKELLLLFEGRFVNQYL
jgi:hypothetical protein